VEQSDVTELLQKFGAGDRRLDEQLLALVYRQLRGMAQKHLSREKAGHTFQPTALVNEVYLRLVKRRQGPLENRTHFFAVAAQVMRQILIDHARERKAQKRGGEAIRVELEDLHAISANDGDTLLDIDAALTRLAEFDPRQAKVVEMRFFGGLTEDEIAMAIGVTRKTVQRDWVAARAWLHGQLSPKAVHPQATEAVNGFYRLL
jgi:RNA polymerase sigma-70 factor, ECF subfamily